jgi:hypothetical protein
MEANHHSPFFKLSSKILKYFLLTLFGFSSACMLSVVFGMSFLAVAMITAFGQWLLRLGIVVLIMMGAAIVFESVRY